MRKLLILAFIVIAKITLAQNKDTLGLQTPFANGKVVYQKTFKAPGKSMAALFNNSRSWFAKRNNGLDSVKTQDSGNGHIDGMYWEILTFKGPLGREVQNRTGMGIVITSKNDSYTVHIANIILGYQEDPDQPRTYFTAEDMMNRVLGKKYPKGSYNPVPFNKKRSKKALVSLNILVSNTIASISQSMSSN